MGQGVKGVVYAALSAACFGMLAVLGKLAYARGFSAEEILLYRFGFAGLMLVCWYAATDRAVLRARPATLAKAAFLGLCLYPAQSLSFMSALKYIPASTTSLILYLYPVVVTLAMALLRRSRVPRIVVLSLALLMAGCALVFYDAFLRSIDQRGLALALTAMFVFSVYLIFLERLMAGENPRTVSLYVILAAACFYPFLGPPLRFLQLDPASQALCFAMGLVPTALAVTLLYRAVELVGSAKASICSTLEPITTVLASALILGETIVPVQVAGMALILAGVALPNLHLLRAVEPVRAGGRGS